MSRSSPLALVLIVIASIIGLIAPFVFVRCLVAQPGLSVAMRDYESRPSCARIIAIAPPNPRKPIPAPDLSSKPCALTGAMIVDKGYTGGFGSATSYALGLRDDAGIDRSVTLAGPSDADFWNRAAPGQRVLVLLFANRAMLLDDGVADIATRDNPSYAAKSNEETAAICGAVTLLEVLGLAALFFARKRTD